MRQTVRVHLFVSPLFILCNFTALDGLPQCNIESNIDVSNCSGYLLLVRLLAPPCVWLQEGAVEAVLTTSSPSCELCTEHRHTTSGFRPSFSPHGRHESLLSSTILTV
jgi:hypothetical protein